MNTNRTIKLYVFLLLTLIPVMVITFFVGVNHLNKLAEEYEKYYYNRVKPELFVYVVEGYRESKVHKAKPEVKNEKVEGDFAIYNVTAYTAGPESTGKTPEHPAYGITASGKEVKEWVTIACPPSMDFGTKVYIPYFDNTFTCQDRGGAIKEGHLDVYMKDLQKALDFGRRDLKVQILK